MQCLSPFGCTREALPGLTRCSEHRIDVSQQPEDPFPTLSPLALDAVKLHEGFKALLAAGFTERQACYLLGAMCAAASAEDVG